MRASGLIIVATLAGCASNHAQYKAPLAKWNESHTQDRFFFLDRLPTTDIDHDGIADRDDACVEERETYNGREDTDGCPDGGRALVSVDEGRGVIRLDHPFAGLDPGSLTQVAHLLLAHPRFEHVQVVSTSGEVAESVRDFMVSEGVDRRRLSSFGPISANREATRPGPRGASFVSPRPLGMDHPRSTFFDRHERVEFRIRQR